VASLYNSPAPTTMGTLDISAAVVNIQHTMPAIIPTEQKTPFFAAVADRIKRVCGSVLPGGGLKAKVLRGGAWIGAGSVAEQVVRFGRNMILTRLIAPEAFGTMAILLSATGLMRVLTDVGVREATIQHPQGTEDRFIRSAFWLSFGRSLSLASTLFLFAPWIARFYGNPELTILLRVAALGFAIDGAASPGVIVAMKNLRFSRLAAINHGGGICGVLITILLSFFIRNVWALVLGLLAEVSVRTLFSYLFYPYVPYFKWDKEAVRELLKFSRGVFGLSFLNLIFGRTDIFVMAKLFPAEQLGIYAMAIYVAQTPTTFLMNMLGQTLMPAFSQLQNEDARMGRVLLQASTFVLCLGMPAVVFAYFCSHAVLTLFYGSRYGVAAGALIVAAAVSVLNLLNAQITTVFYAKGLPNLHRRAVAITAGLMVVLIYPCAKLMGLIGGQVACLLAIAVGFLLQLERIRHVIKLDLKVCLKPFLVGVGISLATGVICSSQHFLAPSLRPVYIVLLGVLGCLAAYTLAWLVFFKSLNRAV
jgi:O-antigen/teichoic acid export membrane protein